MSVSALRQLTGARGEDFYTLRDYGIGDDLRKIHWPSTAKAAKPMIRQEETPWQNRATIVLDDRAGVHDGFGDASSFERSVEAVASVAAMYHSAGYGYRFAAAVERGLPFGRGIDHLHRTLDLLADITAKTGRNDVEESLLLRLTELEAGTTAEGTLVVVGGTLSAAVAVAINRCRRRFRTVITIWFPGHRFGMRSTRARWDGEEQLREATNLLHRGGITTFALGPGESIATAWSSRASTVGRGGEINWGPKPERV